MNDKQGLTFFKKVGEKLIKYLFILNLLFLILNALFNIMGKPELKFVYLAHVILTLVAVILFDLRYVLGIILTLFFLEGQGRIIWSYQSWARVIFDSIVTIAILRHILKVKKLIIFEKLPIILYLMLALHILWYLVQIFNIDGLTIAGTIAATKLYILPLILFLTFVNLEIDYEEIHNLTKVFFIIILVEICICYFQMQEKESLLLKINSYYDRSMRFGAFTGMLFRPFGTTQLPGALATFLFLTAGLLFLKPLKLKENILRFIVILGSSYVFLISQVRSALIKYILIIIFCQLGFMFYRRFKLKEIIPTLIGVSLALVITSYLLFNQTLIKADENMTYAQERLLSLKDTKKLKSSRLSLMDFGKIAIAKIKDKPLGLGPGMTGAAQSINAEAILADPLYTDLTLWTSDNLIISLIMDLGLGFIFYLGFIFFLLLYIIRNLYRAIFYQDENYARLLIVASVTMGVILIGNWGAIGLTYNPESFIFWFLAGLACNFIAKKNMKSPNA